MKKSLAVRTAAIVMVLVSVFFLVLPDMVSAEGDKGEPAAEIAEEQPVEPPMEEEPKEPSQEEPKEPEQEEQPTESPVEEEPKEPVVEEESKEPPIAEKPEEPSDGELLQGGTEEVSAEPSAEEETKEVSTEEQTTEIPEELPSEEPSVGESKTDTADAAEEVKDVLVVDTDTVSILGGAVRGETEEDSVAGFIVEGNTVTGYKGTGGHIAIPDGITTIADNAFFGNTSITGVTFSGSVQTIGSSAFNGCSNLTELSIPASVTTIGVSAFANCTGLASVNLTPSTGTIAEGQFYNCLSLTNVTVPEGISSIASAAFGGCSNLTSVSLPSSLASMDLNAFTGDVNLAAISVAAGNGTYTSYDGCLYTAGSSQMQLCPPGKTSVAFAPSVTGIAGGAFSGCNFITAITVPASVNSIAADAFSGSALQNVTIPAAVTAIGSQSAWTPKVIYGYRDSVAESWAKENHYLFESLDGSSKDKEDEDDNADIGDGGEADKDVHGGNGGNVGNGTNNGSTHAGSNVSQQGGVNTSTVRVAAPVTAAAQEAHIKDVTPKTGVEDYGRNFLFGAVLLLGVAFFAYSKKLESEGL